MSFRKRIFLLEILLIVCVAVGYFVYKKLETPVAIPEIHGMILPETRGIAPFALKQSPDGRAFTERDFSGKWSFLFFGYTHCPDVCPTTMAIMNQIWQLLDKQNATNDLQVILISVDPQRDDLKKLGDYVHYFNPNFMGVTGNDAQLNTLAAQLGIVYEVDAATAQERENYIVNHSAGIIVINPKGEYQAFFSAPHDPSTLVAEFMQLKNYVQHE